jgi:hypothetical protein
VTERNLDKKIDTMFVQAGPWFRKTVWFITTERDTSITGVLGPGRHAEMMDEHARKIKGGNEGRNYKPVHRV